jgi:hypothetical protein
MNQSKIRLRQWQRLTNEQLDEIVRHDIEYLFLKETKNDQRMPRLLERITAQQLKAEMRILFFESLAELLEGEGLVGKNATPYITWYDTSDVLTTYDDSPEYKVNVRMYCLNFYNKDKKHHNLHLDQKIEDIVKFVIKKHIFEPRLEECRSIKPKTLAERTHVRGDGQISEEWDTYNLVKSIGQAISRELTGEQEKIRTSW